MLNIFKESEEKKRKARAEHEKHLKEALAEKCANMDLQYASHEEDETQYTIMTIGGKAIKVKKEEITIGSVTEYRLKARK